VPQRARATRRRLRAAASFVASAFFAIAAAATIGAEPSEPRTISNAAFGPVSLLPAASAAASIDVPAPVQTPDLGVILDPWAAPTGAPRAQPSLPAIKPASVPITTHRISGGASWYCRAGSSPCTSTHPDGSGFDAYGAAGPRLRAAIGSDWRGRVVYVDGIRVKLIDWCQCHQGESNEKLIDLYYDVFARTGGSVTIRW